MPQGLTNNDALNRYLEADHLLEMQDITKLPREGQIRLLEAQRYIYTEIQRLQAQSIEERTDIYREVSPELKKSEADFQEIRNWAEQASKAGEAVDGLARGISVLLSLF
ncbi:MAG: hypothetical protein JJ879_12570 [Sneathiella sp.]|nr:hypothetical protein [Sneathiella sp.]